MRVCKVRGVLDRLIVFHSVSSLISKLTSQAYEKTIHFLPRLLAMQIEIHARPFFEIDAFKWKRASPEKLTKLTIPQAESTPLRAALSNLQRMM